MTNAVSYAYVNEGEERPSLGEQFAACRAYAVAQGLVIVGEYNDINEADHQATGAALKAVRAAVADAGATVILVYQPAPAVAERLQSLGAEVVQVAPTDRERAHGTGR